MELSGPREPATGAEEGAEGPGAVPEAPSTRSRLLRVAFVLVPIAAFLAFLVVSADRSQPRGVGSAAPAFELETLDGSARLSSGDLSGSPYVINFWASWCDPCREESPHLVAVAGDGGGLPRFFGVSMLDGRSEALAFVREMGIAYPNLLDDGRMFRAFGVVGIPETVFVDSHGRIAGRWAGAIGEEDLRRLMDDLLRLEPGQTLRITGSGPAVGVP